MWFVTRATKPKQQLSEIVFITYNTVRIKAKWQKSSLVTTVSEVTTVDTLHRGIYHGEILHFKGKSEQGIGRLPRSAPWQCGEPTSLPKLITDQPELNQKVSGSVSHSADLTGNTAA